MNSGQYFDEADAGVFYSSVWWGPLITKPI